jgi:hypothetical protein
MDGGRIPRRILEWNGKKKLLNTKCVLISSNTLA